MPDRPRGGIAAPAVATSLAAFVIVYVIVFGTGTYYALRILAHPPVIDDSITTENPAAEA